MLSSRRDPSICSWISYKSLQYRIKIKQYCREKVTVDLIEEFLLLEMHEFVHDFQSEKLQIIYKKKKIIFGQFLAIAINNNYW